MAQGSNALRAPNMNDILTSIREIIQENCAQNTAQGNSFVADLQKNLSEKNTGEGETSLLFASANQNSLPSKEDRLFRDGFASGSQKAPSSMQQRSAPLREAIGNLADSLGVSKEQVGQSSKSNVNFMNSQAQPFTSNQVSKAIFPDERQQISDSQFLYAHKADHVQFPTTDFAAEASHPSHSDIFANSLATQKEFIKEQLKLSIESALRDMISQWLNENFAKIFDKILREELKKALK